MTDKHNVNNSDKAEYYLLNIPEREYEWYYSANELEEALKKMVSGHILKAIYVSRFNYEQPLFIGKDYAHYYLGSRVYFEFDNFHLDILAHAYGMFQIRMFVSEEVSIAKKYDVLVNGDNVLCDIEKFFSLNYTNEKVEDIFVRAIDDWAWSGQGFDKSQIENPVELPQMIQFAFENKVCLEVSGHDDDFTIEMIMTEQKILTLCEDKGCNELEVQRMLERYVSGQSNLEWEDIFAEAIECGNMRMLKALYTFCPNPDYRSVVIKRAFMGLMHFWFYLDNYINRDSLLPAEEADVRKEIKNNERVMRYILSHPNAVSELKGDLDGEGSLLKMIVFKLGNDVGGLSLYEMEYLFRLVLVLSAYHCHEDDYGPKIIGEFELDKLDDYRIVIDGDYYKGTWQFLNEKDEIVALF